MSLVSHRFVLPLSLLLATAGAPALGQEPTAQAHSEKPFVVTTVTTFDRPLAMAFLPNGAMLVTEKLGRMILFDPATGSKSALSGMPEVVSVAQGGPMDVALAPDFATSGKIYFSYSDAGEGKTNGVALATAQLDAEAGALRDVTVIYRAEPFLDSGAHYSGRILFSPDHKYLFLTNGERAKGDPAQDPTATLGKVLRLNLDGTPAAGNPLAAHGFHPAIWSFGHRNLTGLAFDRDGRLWEVEMGPLGGDEINLIHPGLNYGWPKVSNGVNYDKSDIPDHAAGDGFIPPKVFWDPSLAPASLAYYDADLFPAWKGSLFVSGLSGMALARVQLDGDDAAKADHWNMETRLRSVRVGPDGALWLLEDGADGKLLKLTPKG